MVSGAIHSSETVSLRYINSARHQRGAGSSRIGARSSRIGARSSRVTRSWFLHDQRTAIGSGSGAKWASTLLSSVGGQRPGQVGFATGAVGAAPAGHDRGSQGWRLDVGGEGVAIAAAVAEVAGVVDGVVEVEPLTLPVVGVVGTGGVVTANWEPVTTVTWAPSAT